MARRAGVDSTSHGSDSRWRPGRSCSKQRSIRLPAQTPRRSRLSLTGSDVGHNQLRTWSFSTEAHWLRDNGFAVLTCMPHSGRGRSEGINGEEDFGRDHAGNLIDVSSGVAQAVEDLESAIAYARKLPGIRSGPLLLAGQSRGGFLAMHIMPRPQARRGHGRGELLRRLVSLRAGHHAILRECWPWRGRQGFGATLAVCGQ